jgi:hypothetical protein
VIILNHVGKLPAEEVTNMSTVSVRIVLPDGTIKHIETRPENNGFKPEWVKRGSTEFAPSKNQPGQHTTLRWPSRGCTSTSYRAARNIAGMVFAEGHEGDPSKGTGCMTLEEYLARYGSTDKKEGTA